MHPIKHDRSQKLIDFAYVFARDAHGDQRRKYTNTPYIDHPVAVALRVVSVTSDVNAICAALLHDVVEDTPVTFDEIRDAGFGHPIAQLVRELTDISRPEDGNRAKRKAMDRAHLDKASALSKTIKLADLIDNSESILKYDPNFAVVYMKEKRALLNVLGDGDAKLWGEAKRIIDDFFLILDGPKI